MAWHNDQVSAAETSELLSIAQKCLSLEGDFVELGCYKGDTSLQLADLLDRRNRTHSESLPKKLWLYDSFEGLPAKSQEDSSAIGQSFQKGELSVSKREVKARFLRANLPVPIIKKAWFGELIDADLPDRIAFAFLDGDLYESIRDSLRLIEDKMSIGSTIIVHDYRNIALPGVAKAVDEWRKRHNKVMKTYETMAVMYY